jgi:hypothetical protein
MALSPVKKERVGLGGNRMGTKKQDCKSRKTCSWSAKKTN